MNDIIDGRRVTGKIEMDGDNIYDPSIDRCCCARASAWCSRSRTRSRSRSTTMSPTARAFTGWRDRRPSSRRSSSTSLRSAGLFEGGEGSPARARHRPVRRPAAAPVHRPRHRRQPGSHPDGRALLGARPDRDRQDRGADRRAARELQHRHRHPLHAAGGPRLAAHGILPSWQAGRGGRDRGDLHQPARSSARRTTSPAASADAATKRQERHERAHRQLVRGGAAPARQEDRADGRARGAAAGAGHRRAGAARSRARREHASQDEPSTGWSTRSRSDHPDDRPAPADGGRSAPDHDGDQDRRRPGAHRRPGQEHRQAGAGRIRREPSRSR